jgi:hypothetical protein
MGCWNGTCALTSLPIHDGERVVMFILRMHGRGFRKDFGGGTCEPYTHARPFGPALRGTYNGYGGVTNLQGEALPWWNVYLAEIGQFLLDEEGELHDFADLDDFINNDDAGVERGGVYVGMPEMYDTNSRLGLMLVHEEAYNRFMAAALASDDWLFVDPTEDPVAHYLKDLQTRVAEVAAQGPDEDISRELVCAGYDMFEALESVLRYAVSHDATDLLKEVACLKIFDMMLGCARKSWDRQCGAGSGNSDTTLQVELARFTLEFAGSSN